MITELRWCAGRSALNRFAALTIFVLAALNIVAYSGALQAESGVRPAARGPVVMTAPDAAAHVAAQVAAGKSAAMGSASLALGNVRFAYAATGSERHAPQLSFTVTNVGDQTIASFNLDARLYLNGSTQPLLGTDFGRAYNKPFFIHLGEAGLAPRSTREVQVVFGLDAYHWVRAEALLARSLAVALRVVDVSDVHMRRLDERSPAFKEPAPVGSPS